MRRLFWIAAGAAAGVYLARRLQRTAAAMTPSGLAASATGALHDVADALRDFTAEVRVGMAEREIELRQALGLGEDESGAASAAESHSRSLPSDDRR